jgi:hypothetical protein
MGVAMIMLTVRKKRLDPADTPVIASDDGERDTKAGADADKVARVSQLGRPGKKEDGIRSVEYV